MFFTLLKCRGTVFYDFYLYLFPKTDVSNNFNEKFIYYICTVNFAINMHELNLSLLQHFTCQSHYLNLSCIRHFHSICANSCTLVLCIDILMAWASYKLLLCFYNSLGECLTRKTVYGMPVYASFQIFKKNMVKKAWFSALCCCTRKKHNI